MPTSRPPYFLVNLANAFLAGPWTPRSMKSRAKRACPQIKFHASKLVTGVLQALGEKSHPLFDDLLKFLMKDPWISSCPTLEIGKYYFLPLTMAPRGNAAQSWTLPSLCTVGQVADWLGLSLSRLDWLADLRGLVVKQGSPRLLHYVCHWQARRRGRFRLIESPKQSLKKVQQRILKEILSQIPPHPAAHGFRIGKSILSYAAPHVGKPIVMRFDLRDFFPTVRASRVNALFRTVGYPQEVARLLTGLCTSRVANDIWEQRPDPRETDRFLWERLRIPHLPQGAPTSPALANLCAFRLDVRLHGLANCLQAVYTRYADDLAFSGGDLLTRSARRFQVAVAVIAQEEGFALHFQKSRFMRQSVCQQLAGIVVNNRPNIRRADYDELKAILNNCVHQGPQTQNRASHSDFRSHLLGRISYVRMIHSERGEKLMRLFERILW